MEYLALIFSQTPENQVDNLRQALLALCVDRNFEITWQTAWAYDFEENSLQISFSLKAEKPNLEALDTIALWQKATENAKNQEINELIEKLAQETAPPYYLYVSPINELSETIKTLHFYWKGNLLNAEENPNFSANRLFSESRFTDYQDENKKSCQSYES